MTEIPTERRWTRVDDVAFESALVVFPEGTVGRWGRIAEVVGGGKTAEEVERHYEVLVDDVVAICSGLIPLPDYPDVTTTHAGTEKRVEGSGRSAKKGKTWSADEHKLFLVGLERYGKGDWRSISRNIVKSKTATQVASHAQKYFKRQESENKGRRTSIHDIKLDSNHVSLSNSMQNPLEGGSLGYDNATNVNYNQDGLMGHDGSNMTSSHPTFTNDEPYLQSHSSMEETRNPYYLTSPSSSFLNHGPSNMYYQGGLSGCNNVNTLSNMHPISLPNQFSMVNNVNTFDTNNHLISPQSRFSPKGGPMGYIPTNMINHSTPPPLSFQNMNNHMGPRLPNSRTTHMPHRSLFMGNDNTRNILPNAGFTDNQAKDDDVYFSTYQPDQAPNGFRF